jgi:hypothetical protein
MSGFLTVSSLSRLCLALGLTAAAALPAQAISNGTPTTAFAPVGFFGMQVAPDWVLTAHHVAAAFFPLNTSTIPFNNGFGERAVIERFDAPGAGPFPANDVSLLRLAPGSGLGALFYQPISTDLFADGTFPALNVTIASAANSPLARAYGHTTVTEFATQIDPDDGGPLGPVTANYLLSFDNSVYVQGGDSGGALFLGHVLDSTGALLLGLSSAQLGEEGQPPAGSGFVQLAAYRGWIDATLSAAAGNTQQLQWVSSVPEASTWLLWGLGLAGLTGTVARRRSAAAGTQAQAQAQA